MLGMLILFCRNMATGEQPHQPRKDQRHDEIGYRNGKRQQRKTCAASHSDSGDKPYGGSGGETRNPVTSHKDQPCANKTDASHNLCGYSGRIQNNPTTEQDVCETLL